MNERIAKGITVTQKAITEKNAGLLTNCFKTFKSIGATPEDITSAVSLCPLSLFSQTGFVLKIHSNLLQGEVVIGKDISWEALQELIEMKMPKEEIKEVFDVQEVFAGNIKSVEKSVETGTLF